MARRKRRSISEIENLDRMDLEERVNYYNPKPALAPPSIIRLLEDRRQFAPVDTYPRGLFHKSTRLVVPQPNVNNKKRLNEVPRKVVFQAPDQVALCVRRKSRREVLFAMKRTGKGSRSRFRRRTAYSKMEC